MFFGEHGFRCIAHDRRGHGRSTQTWDGNDMDTYADDLMALVEALDLKNAIHVGHSTGGGEVARYIGRHGADAPRDALRRRCSRRRAAADAQDRRQPRRPADGRHSTVSAPRMRADRAQFFLDVPTGPFYGFNRPGAKVSEGLIETGGDRA